MLRMNNELQNDVLLFEAIGISPKEFRYLLRYYEDYRRALGSVKNQNAPFRMSSFGAIWPELYLVLDFLKNHSTLRRLYIPTSSYWIG